MTEQIDYAKLGAALMDQMAVRTKDAVSGTPSGNHVHGRGGLFADPGLSKPLFSAMILPNQGLANRLPTRPNNYMDPLFGIITGVTEESGSNPDGPCDDPPTAGTMKLCTHSFTYGRLSLQTKVLDVSRSGQMTNRAEFNDFNVYGDPFNSPQDRAINPTMPGQNGITQATRSEASNYIYNMGVNWARRFAGLTWSGNPANNTANDGYMEFNGMERLVNTGYRDAITGVACPAADSLINSFGGLDVEANSAALIERMTIIYRNLKFLASQAGLDPVTWAICMPYSLFYALTDIWPCSYASYRCSPNTGSTNFIQADTQEVMREKMRGDLSTYTGQSLLIDGQYIPVIIDDTMPVTQPVTQTFDSDIYFIPMTVLNGTPVTYWEHFDFDGQNAAMGQADQNFALPGAFMSSDGGRFLWARKPNNNFCVQVVALCQPRIMLLTPYLAARLTDVRWNDLIPERNWEPGASYHVNGGKTATDTTQPSYYNPTA